MPGAWKFREKYIGPYMILDTPLNVVCLYLPSQIQIHLIVNIEQVRPYHEPIPGQCIYHLELVIISNEGQEEWEAKQIVNF